LFSAIQILFRLVLYGRILDSLVTENVDNVVAELDSQLSIKNYVNGISGTSSSHFIYISESPYHTIPITVQGQKRGMEGREVTGKLAAHVTGSPRCIQRSQLLKNFTHNDNAASNGTYAYNVTRTRAHSKCWVSPTVAKRQPKNFYGRRLALLGYSPFPGRIRAPS